MPCWSAKTRAVLLIAAASVVIAGCGRGRRPMVAAPNFELKDLSGNTVRLDSFRGHPVLLDFWATWCGPCRMSIPLVQEFYKRHEKEGLIVLGLNMDDDPSGVFSFIKHYKMTYPVLLAGGTTVPSDYEVDGIPHFAFIDDKGQIIQIYSGFGFSMIDNWEEDFQSVVRNKH